MEADTTPWRNPHQRVGTESALWRGVWSGHHGRRTSDDLEAATNAYLVAIETNHPDVASNLEWLLAAQGDLAGATTMLRRALEFGHDDVSLRAALKLDSVRAELLIPRWTASRSAAESPERLFQAWASVRVATTSE